MILINLKKIVFIIVSLFCANSAFSMDLSDEEIECDNIGNTPNNRYSNISSSAIGRQLDLPSEEGDDSAKRAFEENQKAYFICGTLATLSFFAFASATIVEASLICRTDPINSIPFFAMGGVLSVLCCSAGYITWKNCNSTFDDENNEENDNYILIYV